MNLRTEDELGQNCVKFLLLLKLGLYSFAYLGTYIVTYHVQCKCDRKHDNATEAAPSGVLLKKVF